jgi:hypothetical protein
MSFDNVTAAACPLDRGFNVAVLQIAARLFPTGFDAAPDAPEDFDSLREHVARTGRMCVSDGASDATIFADAEVNLAFRAWHDHCHLRIGADFSPEGEAAACAEQARDLRTLYPGHADLPRWLAILHAEVVGQGEHLARHGAFPVDQAAFVRSYLTQPAATVAAGPY